MRHGKDFTANPGNSFGERLAFVLKRDGFKQCQFANKAGITPVYINNIIKGRNTPSLNTATDIARLLDVSLDWLCCLED